MEIEINNTPETNDDLVQMKSDHPAHRFMVKCRIRTAAPNARSFTVVLTNPDGRLRFPYAVNRTLTLTVPANGAWAEFRVSGQRGSAVIGDAVIEAHCNTSTGPVTATKPMTVFWFDLLKIRLTPTGSYGFVGDWFTSTGGATTQFAARARIRPAGVDCTVRQVKHLRIAIMQESSNFQTTSIWGNPARTWAAGCPSGIRLEVPTTITETTSYGAGVAQPVRDAYVDACNLYDCSDHNHIDANSLRKLVGCQAGNGAAYATSSDTPSHQATATVSRNYVAGATPVATVTWTRLRATRREHFRTFCVIYNRATKVYSAMRQATWDLNVDSSGAAPQRATATADGPATVDPATGPSANVVNQPTVTTEAGTTSWTSP